MSERSQFVVHHWRRVYRVPRDHPQPEAQRHQLDNLLDGRLIPALEASFTPVLEQQEGVWLINSLETSLTLDNGQLESASLAELISRQVSRRLVQITSVPPDGENVRYFPSRAAFAAQFIRDTLNGSAGDRWEYGAFTGLRSLPLPQLLREAIVRDGAETARGVIAILHQTGRWPSVLNLLSDLDAKQIWLTCTGDLTFGSVRAAEIEWLVAHWSEAGDKSTLWANGKTLLRLWTGRIGDSWSQRPSSEQADAAGSIEAWLAFLDFIEGAPLDSLDFKRFAAGDFTSVPAARREMCAAFLPAIARAARGSAWLEKMARAVIRLPKSESTQAAPDIFTSPCAGLFLLLPVILDLKLPELLEEHAPTPEAARLWLALIALQCLGGPHAAQNSSDPAFLLALGLDEPPAFGGAPPAENLLAAFRERLRASRYITGTHLALSEVDGATLIHDMRMDYWLALTEQPDVTLAQLAQTLEPALYVWQPGDPVPAAEPGATFARFYRSPQPDVEFLRLPTATGLSDEHNRALMPLSQAVLRNFARRLIGFGWSSPAYLHRNILGGGQIVRRPGRIDVALAEVPLSPMLRLTGLHRDEYPYPWDDSLSVRLLLP